MSSQTGGPSRAPGTVVGAGIRGQGNLYSLSPGVQQELRKPEVSPCVLAIHEYSLSLVVDRLRGICSLQVVPYPALSI